MASIKDIQNQIDNNTFDPSKYSRQEKQLIDAAIQKGLLTGPSMSITKRKSRSSKRYSNNE